MSIKLFISYSHRDEAFKTELEAHLAPLRHLNLIDVWSDRKIIAGEEFDKAITERLLTADVILLLISADFFQSMYCWEKELEQSLRRHEAHEAVVIPIVVRSVELTDAPFSGLESLPTDRKPVQEWSDRDKAWTDVARGIRGAIEKVIDRQRRLKHTDARLQPLSLTWADRPNFGAGLQTGYATLDYLLSGLGGSDLIVVAGRPTMGKTSFILNLALNVASSTRSPATVAVFTPENSAASTQDRLIATLARVSDSQLRAGRIDEDAWTRIDGAMTLLAKVPLFLDESALLTPSDVATRAKQLKEEHDLGLILVDTLQMLRPNSGEAKDVSGVLRDLKVVARNLNVPIVVTSHLNPKVDRRVDKKPLLIDLPSEYNIQEYADVVLLLFREDHYYPATVRNGFVDVIVAKNRKGDTGELMLVFSAATGRLDNFMVESSS